MNQAEILKYARKHFDIIDPAALEDWASAMTGGDTIPAPINYVMEGLNRESDERTFIQGK